MQLLICSHPLRGRYTLDWSPRVVVNFGRRPTIRLCLSVCPTTITTTATRQTCRSYYFVSLLVRRSVMADGRIIVPITTRAACNFLTVFTARCTLVRRAVLRSHVVCVSATFVNCDHIGWNSSKIISPLARLGCSLFATPTWRVCPKGNTPKFGPKVTHPLLIWALETFDCKLRPNGYTQRNGNNGEPIYRKPPPLSRMVPSLTPYDLPFPPKMGVPYAPIHAAAILDNFEWPYLCNGSRSIYIARIARAVIFAIAQLYWCSLFCDKLGFAPVCLAL